MSEPIWIRHEIPWVGHGFVHPANEDAADALKTRLRDLGFDLFELRGDQMADERSIHDELARAFGFPDYYGHNWDAFNESWADIEPTLPACGAILWHRADLTASQALRPFSEAMFMLIRASDELERREPPKQLELFLLGLGQQFPGP